MALSAKKITKLPRNSDVDRNISYSSEVRLALTLRASTMAVAPSAPMWFSSRLQKTREVENDEQPSRTTPLFCDEEKSKLAQNSSYFRSLRLVLTLRASAMALAPSTPKSFNLRLRNEINRR
jgi:hypothetical protein